MYNYGYRVSHEVKEDAYNWVYKYIAEDASENYYTKIYSFEPTGMSDSVSILVDKNNPAHNLEIRLEAPNNWITIMLIVIILVFMLIALLPFAFIMFLISKLISKTRK